MKKAVQNQDLIKMLILETLLKISGNMDWYFQGPIHSLLLCLYYQSNDHNDGCDGSNNEQQW